MNGGPSKATQSRWKSVLVVVVGVLLGWWFFWTGPVTKPVVKEQPAKVVQTIRVRPGTQPITITAYGTVIPARQVTIQPEVTGLVARQHPELMPGGRVKQGEVLFEIDPTLMELTVEESAASVAQAEAGFKEAERKRDEAQRLANDHLVPESELKALEAAVRIRKADLERLKAGLARSKELLKRHQVRAPFNALVVDEAVETGQRVDTGFEAVTLVGTDEFWIKAALPMDKLERIDSRPGHGEGLAAEVYLATGDGKTCHRSGRVVRVLGDLEKTGRMARVLVKIADPLGLQGEADSEPFLLNSYVRVEIDAGTLENVLAIDRAALRENQRIWVVGADHKLQIRDVTVRWSTEETIYIDNVLKPDEVLVVSSLRVALPGMKVRMEPADPPPPTEPEGGSNQTVREG